MKKSNLKTTCFLTSFFSRFWGACQAPFSTNFPTCFDSKTCQFSNRFSDVIFIAFGVPKPPRLSSHLYETLKTKNTRFPFLTPFWMHFGLQNGCNILPKCIQRSNKKSDEFCIEKKSKNGPHLGVQGGSNEPAFHSQNSVWDPLGTPRGARGPPEGPLDDF